MSTCMTIFKPFVMQLGEHLDGIGSVCQCTRYSRRVPVETTVPRPPSVTPGLEPKQASYRVPQWDETERHLARRKGYQVKVMSEGGFRQ
jgi:hypothetical protein